MIFVSTLREADRKWCSTYSFLNAADALIVRQRRKIEVVMDDLTTVKRVGKERRGQRGRTRHRGFFFEVVENHPLSRKVC